MNPENLKNAMRERERSSAGDREEAKIARRTAGVTGIRLLLPGLTVPASELTPGVVLAGAPACAEDAESGYGRCDWTGDVEAVVAFAAAYVAGVMVHVLGVELVGVRQELELERTEDEGDTELEAAIVRFGYRFDLSGLLGACFFIDM